MNNNRIIPFGKYKDQPVEILQSDPDYAKWLLAQPWFGEKFVEIKTLIINNFNQDSDTPEHNELQLRFLDRDLSFGVLSFFWGTANSFSSYMEKCLAAEKELEETSHRTHSLCSEFEVDGWDVVISGHHEFEYKIPESHPKYNARKKHEYYSWGWGGSCFVELKPSIGDDFPSILRKVKSRINERARRGKVAVIYERWDSSSGVSLVKEMFLKSNIILVCMDEISPLKVPPEFEKR